LSDIIILANRRHLEVTMELLREIPELDTSKAKMMNAGIRIQESCLDQILPIRTYQEILFLVNGMKTCELDAKETAKKIVESRLIEFLEKRHTGGTPFYFRIELKSKLPLDKKSAFLKKLAVEIEQGSERRLINSTSRYEVEIRLIETKEGSCNVLVKLFTIPDLRFAYRKEVTAASIKPVNAALIVTLARDYMVEDAQVLDPFCGVGTMLIERQKQIPANTSYGIDILEEAVSKARSNTEAAGQIIHYINRDYFDFTHQYLFDEIFTNMPFDPANRNESKIYDLYEHFFDKSREHLKNGAVVILYSHDREYVRELAPAYGYRIVRETEVNTKEETFLFILNWEGR
jgi:23S rRNA G2445 N2-methylase RlmL